MTRTSPAPHGRDDRPSALTRRTITAVLLGLAIAVAGCGESASTSAGGDAARAGTSSDPAPSATTTPDPAIAARSEGRRLVKAGQYAAAVAAYEAADLDADADRARRRGA